MDTASTGRGICFYSQFVCFGPASSHLLKFMHGPNSTSR
jgi:hypothetical protein